MTPSDRAGTHKRTRIAALAADVPAILPSLLLCDFGNLEREVRRLEAAGVPALHLDVMDGHFVPNLSYGFPIMEAVRKLTELPLDAHLMISDPAKYFEEICATGVDLVTFHVEAVTSPIAQAELLRRFQDRGLAAGLAINPNTPLEALMPNLALCDAVLVMSVMPGFGGQSFNRAALDRLQILRDLRRPDAWLEVDGGINTQTVAACAQAGATHFVTGSAIFKQADYALAVEQMRQLASRANGA